MGSRLGVANPQAKKLIKVAGYDSSINISLPLVNTKANVRYSKFMAFSIRNSCGCDERRKRQPLFPRPPSMSPEWGNET